jgi:hypothetical protein
MGKTEESTLKYSDDSLYDGYAHSIADMNKDFIPDLILTTKVGKQLIQFKVLTIDYASNQYVLYENYVVPDDSFIYGQSLIADFG